MPIDLATRCMRRQDVLAQNASGTLVLLDPESGEYFSLNEVGTRVWELCDGTRTVGGIVGAVVEEYDAPADAIERDVLELLSELASDRLVLTES